MWLVWDQLVLDFAPVLLPRADKWSQLISSDFFFFFFCPRVYPRQGFRSSSKSPALVSLDFVVVVIDKYWVIHKPLVRAFGSISQLQLLAGRWSRVLEIGRIHWEKNCTILLLQLRRDGPLKSYVFSVCYHVYVLISSDM